MILRAENRDCMEIMKEYPDKYFDLAVVDPPYGIGDFNRAFSSSKSKSKNRMKVDWNSDGPNQEYFNELIRISKKRIIWGANYFNCFEKGGALIWFKNLSDKANLSQCEIASLSFQIKVDYIRIDWQSGFIRQIYEDKTIHPCQKPIRLYEWIYKNYAKPEFKVIDTHSGSFSNIIAAINYGIKEMVCCEIDKDYFTDGMNRVNEYLKQGNLFMNEKIIIQNDTQMKIF